MKQLWGLRNAEISVVNILLEKGVDGVGKLGLKRARVRRAPPSEPQIRMSCAKSLVANKHLKPKQRYRHSECRRAARPTAVKSLCVARENSLPQSAFPPLSDFKFTHTVALLWQTITPDSIIKWDFCTARQIWHYLQHGCILKKTSRAARPAAECESVYAAAGENALFLPGIWRRGEWESEPAGRALLVSVWSGAKTLMPPARAAAPLFSPETKKLQTQHSPTRLRRRRHRQRRERKKEREREREKGSWPLLAHAEQRARTASSPNRTAARRAHQTIFVQQVRRNFQRLFQK